MKQSTRRVVVTGLGIVSPVGIGRDEFWQNLKIGKSGIGKISLFDTSQFDRHNAGEIKNFDVVRLMDSKQKPRFGKASQLAVVATRLSIQDASLDLSTISSSRIGLCLGTTMGEHQILTDINYTKVHKGLGFVNSLSVSRYPAQSIAFNVAHEFSLGNKNIVFTAACASGNYSIGYAYDLIRMSKADFMIAGGVDALSKIAFTGFNRLFAMAPEKCQPFDKNRKGMIVGEGAGMILLETLENALKRKAHIYAEILGYGMSCDAQHMTIPSVDGIAKAITKTLTNARLRIDDINYISAHGTGTFENDKAECEAIKRIFGNCSKKIAVSSIKSMIGHSMGAAAAIEAVSCCLAIQSGIVPPTINYENPDPDCDIDCVPNESRKVKINVALNNSLAFGGNNACLAIGRCK